jgi:hypothetical protein
VHGADLVHRYWDMLVLVGVYGPGGRLLRMHGWMYGGIRHLPADGQLLPMGPVLSNRDPRALYFRRMEIRISGLFADRSSGASHPEPLIRTSCDILSAS